MTFRELIEDMAKRPPMYLGNPTLSRLDAFLLGWASDPTEVATLREFQNWVSRRYEVTSSQGWAQIIDYWCTSDAEALQTAFTLLKEFLDERERLGNVS